MFPQLSDISGWQHFGHVSKGPAQAPCIQQKSAAGLVRFIYVTGNGWREGLQVRH